MSLVALSELVHMTSYTANRSQTEQKTLSLVKDLEKRLDQMKTRFR